jgi:hypothetical protein
MRIAEQELVDEKNGLDLEEGENTNHHSSCLAYDALLPQQ